jgi:hypothetical protein
LQHASISLVVIGLAASISTAAAQYLPPTVLLAHDETGKAVHRGSRHCSVGSAGFLPRSPGDSRVAFRLASPITRMGRTAASGPSLMQLSFTLLLCLIDFKAE